MFIIVDTSTEKTIVFFSKQGEVVLSLPSPEKLPSSATLIPVIESGLHQLSCSISDLEGVGVGIGPGSYTGVRVGVAAAKGIAASQKLPLISFCSLEGFVYPEMGKFLVLMNASSGGSYVLWQQRTKQGVTPAGSPEFVSKEVLQAYIREGTPIVNASSSRVDEAHLAQLVWNKYRMGHYGEDTQLLYLRTPQYRMS